MPQRRSILIIDDEPTIVKGIQLRLQKAGFEAITAHDGRTGVRLAMQTAPDLVLMDCEMPVMDGFNALGFMKQHVETSEIPVILISGRDSDRDEALAAGAAAFLAKPFGGQELMLLIDELTLANCANESDKE